MWYLYKITNTVNGKVYIGQSVNPSTRWSRHKSNAKYNAKNQNVHLTNAIRKYGVEKFSFEIIGQAKTLEDMDEFEIMCIRQYNATNPIFGYNVSIGGQGKRPMSTETKIKLSNALKGRKSTMKGKHHTPETKQLLSIANKGKKWRLGCKISQKTRDLLSQINTGKKASPATLVKMSISMLGKNIGNKNGMFGKPSPQAKLTQQQVYDIRHEYAHGEISYKKLATKHGVSKRAIINVVQGRSYK